MLRFHNTLSGRIEPFRPLRQLSRIGARMGRIAHRQIVEHLDRLVRERAAEQLLGELPEHVGHVDRAHVVHQLAVENFRVERGLVERSVGAGDGIGVGGVVGVGAVGFHFEDIQQDVRDRLREGRGVLGVADRSLPAAVDAAEKDDSDQE